MQQSYLLKMNKSFISGFVKIKDGSISSSKGNYTPEGNLNFPEFVKALYQYHSLDYPKFYKMDNLCKLAFISAELLFKENDFRKKYNEEEIGIILGNCSSTIDTDCKHIESIKDKSNYFPSPSIFVYTLPNIAIGEICIRNSIKGENALFIFEEFDIEFTVNYIIDLLECGKIKSCVGGWIEYSQAGYESFLYIVENENKIEQKQNLIPFSPEEIRKIYFTKLNQNGRADC